MGHKQEFRAHSQPVGIKWGEGQRPHGTEATSGRGEQLLQSLLLFLCGCRQGLSQLLLRHHVEHPEGEEELVLGCAGEGIAQEVGKAADSVLLGVQWDPHEPQHLRGEQTRVGPGPRTDGTALAGGPCEPLGQGKGSQVT